MKTLRVRLALLLLGAIVSVLVLVTAAVLYTFRPTAPEQIVGSLAREVALIVQLAEAGAPASGLSIEPPRLEVDEQVTRDLRNGLQRLGGPQDVIVGQNSASETSIAVKIGARGWLTFPSPSLPPREGLERLFLAWIFAIALGIGILASLVAQRMTRPIQVIESMVANIGDEGKLPVLPEDGPAEVRAVASAVNRLSARLEAAVESRMRLVAAAGHDLRTPITRLRLRAEFVEDEDRAAIMRDLDELESIADSAIALVRLETIEEAREPVELSGLVAEIVVELRSQGLTVSTSSSTPVYSVASSIALKRALRNLLTNACTHGEGAAVTVEGSSDLARITISDHGPGIPEELIDHVLEPFFRVDSARRKTIPGAGLGLSIANEIIKRSGGSLSIENRETGGLAQTVLLPHIAPPR